MTKIRRFQARRRAPSRRRRLSDGLARVLAFPVAAAPSAHDATHLAYLEAISDDLSLLEQHRPEALEFLADVTGTLVERLLPT